MKKHIAIVLGTRPEIIKLVELITRLKSDDRVKTTVIFTGQHYDYNLCQVFMDDLKLPKIDKNLGISGTRKEQVKKMVSNIISFIKENKVDVVVAEGDTNSVLAAALAAYYTKTKFAHVEAGLRSFDSRMPEEWNRVLSDNISFYSFAPTELAAKNLQKSKCYKGGIVLTGNTIVEAVQKNLEQAKKSEILDKLNLQPGKYAVLTAHRQEYVDTKENLEQLIKALGRIDFEIIFPIHPRTEKMLKEFNLLEKLKGLKNLRIIEPVGYFDFLKLSSNSAFLLSDSGGIQEEASVYKRYVIVMRDNTERPEILGTFGELTGYNAEKIVDAVSRAVNSKGKLDNIPCPFGDGKASERIANILVEK
ncbi:MAG: UDP-N-acetylglucosamine 2-epimerase (non-hydrolyzing) [Candidatus Diapherotrites archaeon]|uniref:UDP-N-acetylglucosamine 2-epimerase (Non-hydrolyzing) n=1 Tax=Candidatus Iainarchaeum sp. TaxID=3101447 RepID=A0A2D6M022_9ARCH|nr:UDP-N-acetylglucosamine 2-epimerase (non-hydrolyzing) [Candidatus Diapherotrites archaeon]|tara:strand:+ start:1488 stop:2573 length:1086 start_codon:yes stop_codon:yes gene_type:complete